MFDSDVFEERLSEKRYLQLLNEACVQYEQDDPEFIRITNRIYEVVNSGFNFEELKSTRFYGPFVLYLTWYKKLDNIISHYIKEQNIDDLKLIGKLYCTLNEESIILKANDFDSDEEMSVLKAIEVNIFVLFKETKPIKNYHYFQLLILKELKENNKSELALKNLIKKKLEVKN
jgi:hypothetical protein